MGVKRYLRSRQYRLVYNEPHQSGINMVDLMMWLVIAALIIAAALQAIGSYQKGTYIYHMKSDLEGAVSIAAANGTSSGTIDEAHVAAAVADSNKSEGVTLTWGIIVDSSVAEGVPGSVPLASAKKGAASEMVLMSAASSLKPAILPASTSSHGPGSSYVLVAHHAKVPDLEVIYFFDPVNHFTSGYSILPTQPDMEIAGGLEVYWIGGDEFWDPAVSGAGDGAYTPPVAPSSAPTGPAPVPTSTAPATSPTGSATATPAPTTSTAPAPAPTASPTPTSTYRPTYLPPVTPAENLDKNNKKFMFCHDGTMHSNSFLGMVNGHEHHSTDIMPPVPPQNYAGHNWNSVTARTFYNNCVPVE